MRPRKDTARHPARRRVVCLLLMVSAVTLTVVAQNALPPGFRSYPIRHRDVQEIAPQLRTMLSGVDREAQVLVDKELNRLVVQGSAEAQQLATQFVTALDQPEAAPAQNAQPTPIVRAYPTNGSDPDAVAAKLRQEFRTARVQSDPRTQQVIVLAPEGTHRQIAAVFQPSQPAPERGNAGHVLKHISWREFEVHLRHLWGPQVSFAATRNNELATVTLNTASGPQPIMQVDRRANMVTFNGDVGVARVWRKLTEAIDKPLRRGEESHLVALRNADPAKVQRAVALVQPPVTTDARGQATATIPLGRGRFEDQLRVALQQNGQAAPANQPPDDAPAGQTPPADQLPGDTPAVAGSAGLIGNVQIEFLEGLDTIIIRGRPQDVQRVREIIDEIERLSVETQPVVEILPLQHVNSEALVELVLEVYEEILSPRQGVVTIRSLGEPNAVLLIGRAESVKVVKDLIAKLDQPTTPSDRFEVFRLKHIAAATAEAAVRDFFSARPGFDDEPRPGLGTRVQIIADIRTNTLVVQASPRDMAEVRRFIETLDVYEGENSSQVRVFKLKNALAEELATVLQDAISGDGTGQVLQPGQPGQAGASAGGRPSGALEFILIDEAGGRLLRSGIAADVQISADSNTNSLVVVAPPASMDLIDALIKQLDQMPDAEAKIKVFTVENGDATTLAATMQQLFGQQVTIGQGTGGALGIALRGVQQQQQLQGVTGGESSLIPLTFAVDARTNSVIVSGSETDLDIVETLLLRLDESGFSTNQLIVYRLKNNSSDFVAAAIQNYVTQQRTNLNLTVNSGLSTALDQLALQTIVISEPQSNSVVISVSPRYSEDILQVIKDLDFRPPMVMVQVLIAEVTLTDVFELGTQVGFQDALLFDRGIAGTSSNPGFNFGGVGLPNLSDARRNTVGTQSIADLGVGRAASLGAGPGGLVLSAASDSINVLVRALEEEGRLQILSRPQVMALNNQQAVVSVGRDISRVSGTTVTNGTVTSNVVDVETGLTLQIQPRINDDGVVVMTVDATKSELGSVADGTQIPDGVGGFVIARPIDRTTAQTTISAKSGQTVVLGGLITKNNELQARGVPWLRDVPVIGRAFEFDATRERRTELLVIMTPYIVTEDEDYEMIKMMESQRMHWCLADVVDLDGERGLEGAGCFLCSNEVPVIYPDLDPTASGFVANGGEHDSEHQHQPSSRRLTPTPPPQMAPLQTPPESSVENARALSQLPPVQNPPASPAGFVPVSQVPQSPPTGYHPPATHPPQQATPTPRQSGFNLPWFPFRR